MQPRTTEDGYKDVEFDANAVVEVPFPPMAPAMSASLPRPGISCLCLTPEEETALQVEPDVSDIELKEGLAYLSHTWLRRRFNTAFGISQWTILREKSEDVDGTIIMECSMYVRGHFIGQAYGAASYATNPKMDWADAMESAESECIRRFGKRLGCGLQVFETKWLSKNGFKSSTVTPRRPPAKAPPARKATDTMNKPPATKEESPTLSGDNPITHVVTCPECKTQIPERIRPSKLETGGWFCWKKMEGCGWTGEEPDYAEAIG